MAFMKFYVGNEANASSHRDGIYIAVDTKKIFYNGSAYGGSEVDLSNYYTIAQVDGKIGTNVYTGANYISKETNLTEAALQLDEEIKATNDNLALEHTNAEATYAKKTELGNYLPLAGGTMTGNIIFVPIPNANGHEYVDLGLPSGNLWAKCNVGAKSEEEEGLYFSWADTQGYTKEQIIGGDHTFNLENSKFYVSGKYSQNNIKYSKYVKGSKILELEDDAVNVNWGGSWKMPTSSDIRELIRYTKCYAVLIDNEEVLGTVNRNDIKWEKDIPEQNLKGIKFYNKTDKDKYIFIPFTGKYENNLYYDSYTFLWSSTISGDSTDSEGSNQVFPFTLAFNNFKVSSAYGSALGAFRWVGTNVRGILAKSDYEGHTGGIIISGKSDTDLVNAAGSTTSIDELKSQLNFSGYLPLSGGTMTGTIRAGDPNSNSGEVEIDPNATAGISMTKKGFEIITINSKYGIQFRCKNTWSEGGSVSMEDTGFSDSESKASIVFRPGGLGKRQLIITKDGINIDQKTDQDLLHAGGGTTSVSSIVTQVQASIVDSAPETLDTLNELAAALGDDPNFATTITNKIAGKQDKLVSGTNIKTINGQSLLGSGNFTLNIPSLNGYATQAWVNGKGFLTSIPSEYVTDTELNGRGFLTKATADSTYQAKGNYLTSVSWSQISGKPTFATVATSGSYNDLTNKPAIPSAYTLPKATTSTLGGIKVGDGLEITSDGTLNCIIDPGSGSVSWGNISGKPSVFATNIASINDLNSGWDALLKAAPNIPSLNGYATQAWVNGRGFLTKTTADGYYQPKGNYLTSVSWSQISGKPTIPNVSAVNNSGTVVLRIDSNTITFQSNKITFNGSSIMVIGAITTGEIDNLF